jgi:hypothetical protein
MCELVWTEDVDMAISDGSMIVTTDLPRSTCTNWPSALLPCRNA